jgi:hypothetical protein
MSTPRPMTASERRIVLAAARALHSDRRCIYVAEAGDVLFRATRCLVCGRPPESSDTVEYAVGGGL